MKLRIHWNKPEVQESWPAIVPRKVLCRARVRNTS